MKGTTHVRYELLRALRSRQTLFLSFAIPTRERLRPRACPCRRIAFVTLKMRANN